MDDHDLERLEQDLDAVAGRLGERLDWDELEPRVRWALGRPRRDLIRTLVLVAAGIVLGFWTPSGWMLACGLLLAVVPGRVRAVRERGRTAGSLGRGDLLELVREELASALARHFTRALVSAGSALLFVLVAIVARDPRPGLGAAGVLALVALVRFFWLLPRASRALREFEQGGGAR